MVRTMLQVAPRVDATFLLSVLSVLDAGGIGRAVAIQKSALG